MEITYDVVMDSIRDQLCFPENEKDIIDDSVIVELDDLIPCRFSEKELKPVKMNNFNGIPYIFIRDENRVPVARLYCDEF